MGWFYEYYKKNLKTYGEFLPPLTCTGTRLVVEGHTFQAELRAYRGMLTVYITAEELDKGPEHICIQMGTEIHLPDYGIAGKLTMVQGHPIAEEVRTYYGLSFLDFTIKEEA